MFRQLNKLNKQLPFILEPYKPLKVGIVDEPLMFEIVNSKDITESVMFRSGFAYEYTYITNSIKLTIDSNIKSITVDKKAIFLPCMCEPRSFRSYT